MNQSQWIFYGDWKTLPNQGWKVHLSMTPEELKYNLEYLKNLFGKQNIPFKIPASEKAHLQLCDPIHAGSSIGKIVTAYFSNKSECEISVRVLKKNLSLKKGPRVSTSKSDSFPLVGTRFGGFKLFYTEDNNGTPVRVLENGEPDEIGEKASKNFIHAPCGYPLKNIKLLSPLHMYVALSSKKPGLYKALSREDGHQYIVKSASRGYQLDSQGSDAMTRLKNEAEILERLYPHLQPTYHQIGKEVAILLRKYVPGSISIRLPPHTFFKAAGSLIKEIEWIHKKGIIHRDIKPSNILLEYDNKGLLKASLIDFEASWYKENTYPSDYLSRGYIKESSALRIPTIQDDYFGLAVTLLVWWTGLLPESTYLPQKLYLANSIQSIPLAGLKDIIEELLKNDGEKNLTKILNSLHKLESSIFHTKIKIPKEIEKFQNRDHSWKNNHLFPPYNMRAINIGSAGIHFALHYFQDEKYIQEIHAKGLANLATRKWSENSFGLFTGNMGVFLCLNKHKVKPKWNFPWKKLAQFIQRNDNPDLFSGLSGIMLGLLSLEKKLPQIDIANLTDMCALRLLNLLDQFQGVIGAHSGGDADEPRDVLLGAAHGSSGIALALGQYGILRDHKEFQNLSKCMLQKLVEKSQDLGFLPLRIRRGRYLGKTSSQTWCHGELGLFWVIKLLKYLTSELKTASSLYLDKLNSHYQPSNPSVCHGLAGILDFLNLFLNKDLHDTSNMMLNHLKVRIINDLLEMRSKDGLWMSDQGQITPDLWVGSTGPALVLKQTLTSTHKSLFHLLGII